MKTLKIALLLLGMLQVSFGLSLNNESQVDSTFFKQSRSMAYTIAEVTAFYQEHLRFPKILPNGRVEAFEPGIFMIKDYWYNPYWMQISSFQSDLLIVSYGSDGMKGGEEKRADWIYELSMQTNGAAIVRILNSPAPETSRNLLVETLTGMLKNTGFPISFSVEMPGTESVKRLESYNWCEQEKQSGLNALIKYYIGENGGVLYLAVILLAMGWFWYRAVFKEQTEYLFFVVVLCFPLIFFWWSFSGGIFGLLGFATLILKATRTGTCRNQHTREYLSFFIVMILLAIISGLII